MPAREATQDSALRTDSSSQSRYFPRITLGGAVPLLLKRVTRRKRLVTGRWDVDETYIKVRGQGMYPFRTIDGAGDTVEFFFSEHRDLSSAKRFIRKEVRRHGRPE